MALNGLRVVAVVEARMTSTRLPGKVLMPAGGRPLLQVLVERLRKVTRIDEIVIATTTNATDEPIVKLAGEIGVSVFRGSEDDVLQRVSGCLQAHRAQICVEITGDCPLVDPAIVNEALDAFAAAIPERVYLSNSDPERAVPAGLDVQIFLADALYQLDRESNDPADREHVSYGFYRPESGGRWNPLFIRHPAAAGSEDLLLTLDYVEDYELIKTLHEELSAQAPDYGVAEMARWVREHPEMHERCAQRRTDAAA